MKTIGFIASLLLLSATAQAAPIAPEAAVAELMVKPLADYPGKEALMLIVDYPPGAIEPVHHHDAHAFLYVLEGSIVMGVRGGKPLTLSAGQTFYEGPHDVHTIGRNASLTKPAKFLVVLIKKNGAPVAMPAH